MNMRLFVAISLLVAGAGCLPEDPAVQGRLLYPGINVENPTFADYEVLGGEPWVFFNVRQRRPADGLGGMVDLHRVHWDDGRLEVVVAGVSERSEWSSHETDAEGATYYMLEERLVEKAGLAVGTLARVTLEGGIRETIPDVLSYGLHSSRQRFHYKKHVPSLRWPELHLRTLAGEDRNLGPVSGQIQFVGTNKLYFISGDDQTMVRMVGLDSEPQVLRAGVTRFELHYLEKLAIVTIKEEMAVRTVILDLDTFKERPLPVENPCCWLGLRGNVAMFAESASGGTPGQAPQLRHRVRSARSRPHARGAGRHAVDHPSIALSRFARRRRYRPAGPHAPGATAHRRAPGPSPQRPEVHLRRQAPHLHRARAGSSSPGGQQHALRPADGPGRRAVGPACPRAVPPGIELPDRAQPGVSACPSIGPAR